jgi:hypothetical protein
MRTRIFGCLAVLSCLIAAPASSAVILSGLDPVDVDDNFTSTAREFIAPVLFVNESSSALDPAPGQGGRR